MRRADRLFQIVQQLRAHRIVTAAQLAARLDVSERTIYRDIDDLSLSGVPIHSERGIGYALNRHFDVPPLMFTFDEVEALTVGARMVQTYGGGTLAAAAATALEKIACALPASRRNEAGASKLFVPDVFTQFAHDPEYIRRLELLRQATNQQTKIWLRYEARSGEVTERLIRPLGLFFWGAAWGLAAWCELRKGFRSFRLGAIQEIEARDTRFMIGPGEGLEDFLELMRNEDPGLATSG